MRKANIELLRIISMIMVLTLHYLGQGQVFNAVEAGTFNYYFTRMLEAMAIVAVNCYVLISGYFLVEGKFKISKVIKLCGEVLFYSITIYLLLVALGKIQFSLVDLVYAVFPVLSRKWAFVTDYAGLYLLSPFLNAGIHNMNKKQHFCCLICVSGMLCVVPTCVFWTDTFVVNGGYSLIWFVCLYITAAYIRLYYDKGNGGNNRLYGGIYLICCFVTMGVSIALQYLTGDSKWGLKVYNYNSLPVYVASLSLFLLFLGVRINKEIIGNVINRIAPLTFGIFLIHSHFSIRESIWIKLGSLDYANSEWMIVHLIASVLFMFTVCGLIDVIRKQLGMRLKVDHLIRKITREG